MKISIITATWNSAETLRDTMDSVLGQTYQDIEHIIIDGMSKDHTMELIHMYEPRYQGRLRYISEPDKGIYDAMNKGIQMASGDIIGILNSDDFYTSSDVLEKVVARMERNDIDALYGDIHYVAATNLSKCVRYYSSKHFHRCWMRLGFMPAHPSFYCRKDIYRDYGMFNTTYHVAADFENLLRLIYIRHIRTAYLPIDFVTMRTGGVSTSGIKSHKQIMKEHLRALKTNGIYSNVALLSLRYLYKVYEIAKTRLQNFFPDTTRKKV